MARKALTTQRRRRPNNNWGALATSDYVTVAGNTKVLVASVALSNPGIDETIMRIIGSINVVSDQAAALERQIGAAGLIVVTDLALAAGAASIPGPSTDAGDDGWFCHQFFSQFNQLSDGNTMGFQYDFSSKGRRVVEDGKVIAVMVENSHATESLLINLQFRILGRVTGT